jgi:Undecaprenyl-phosphate glucose phosphotransferase
MLKRYHHLVGRTFRVIDACVIGGIWLASYWLRFTLPLIQVTKGFPKFQTYASLCPLVMALWTIVFNYMGVYGSKRMLRRTQEAFLLLRAHAVAMIFFLALTYMFSEYKYSRGVMVYFGVLGAAAVIVERLLLRNALRALRRKGYRLQNLLIVGEGAPIETLIARMDKYPELGVRVAGVLVDPASQTREVRGKPVVGRFADLSSAIERLKIARVLISLPRDQSGQLDSLLSSLKDETIDVQLIPDIHEFVTLGCEIEDFDGLPILHLNDSPLDGWGAVAKRLTDLFVSLAALLLLSPFLALIALAVRLTSRGPVFYAQERMGLDGRTFEMLKFRSMRTDAEAKSGAVWAQAGDDRRTPIGAFLRATSLDELPQFWNVLRGDMSLVGPRPERPVFVTQFRQEIPLYMLRHKVKAGITGWAQVNGWRGNTSLDRRIECDLYYIRNWSYALDWKILLLTLWKGFINKNAY